MIIKNSLTLQEKLAILSDAAKYDVACTSSGVDRKGQPGMTGNAASCGICHSFSADGRCISLLKILLTNECVFDCRYCINRCSNDTIRTSFTPDEVCQLTMEFYKRNYIEGLFLSSGICGTPEHTMQLIILTLQRLRDIYGFNGYIHVKAIPGVSPELVRIAGFFADRMSINLEFPTAGSLTALAPAKTRQKILTPMRLIQSGIQSSRPATIRQRSADHPPAGPSAGCPPAFPADKRFLPDIGARSSYLHTARFVPAGQSTQMIIGATPETDYQILSVTQALYRRFSLKRVFYSAYTPLNDDGALPPPGTPVPLLREHRLYQADWLLRYYDFEADELLSEENPSFDESFDPKCNWALHHPEFFPVEVRTADYHTLLRVPGLGVRSAKRIRKARRYTQLTFEDLRRIGVRLKNAKYFITCGGKRFTEQLFGDALPEDALRRCLLHPSATEENRQLSLFEDFHLSAPPPVAFDTQKTIFGEL